MVIWSLVNAGRRNPHSQPLQLGREFRKVSGHVINILKTIAFLYISNIYGETKFKKRCHLQQIKSLKHPGTNRIEYISHGLCELHLLLIEMRETLKTVERGAMITD